MLIRNQDRTKIVDMVGMVLNAGGVTFEMQIFAWSPSVPASETISLGKYDTPERVIEVLDEIQNAYQHNVAVYKMPEK